MYERSAGVLAAFAVLATAGCGEGGDSSAGDDGPRRYVVEISDRGYAPDHLRIEVGDRVTFVNRSDELPHTAKDDRRGEIQLSSGPGPTDHSGKDVNYATKRGFGTHSLFPDEPQTIVFTVPRRYVYHCSFHPEETGVVEVVRDGG